MEKHVAAIRVAMSIVTLTVLSNIVLLQTVAGQCVDVVQHCGAKPDNHTDSAQAFTDCLHLASHRSGCIVVPPGPYRLTQVVLNVSNIEIRVSNDAVFRPWQDSGDTLFVFGSHHPTTDEYVQNVSLHGEAPGHFTVDVHVKTSNSTKPWKAHAVSLTGGIKGFLVANMHCWMANFHRTPQAGGLSSMPCITSSYATFNGTRLNTQDGILQNLSCKDCTFGYGLIQVLSGERMVFENLYSEGGITLRLETGNGIVGGYVGEITGQNITCKDGHSAFLAAPHVQKNDVFHVKDLVSLGCYSGVLAGFGFSQGGYPPGYFGNSSTISNVIGVYGTHAQNSSLNVDVPSCAVCSGTVFNPAPITIHRWDVTVTNVMSRGFPAPSNRSECVYSESHAECYFDKHF